MTSSSQVSFTVRRPSPISRDVSSGPDSESDGPFRLPALPKHLANSSSLPGSPLARSATSSPKGKPITYYDGEPDSSDEEDQEQDELVTGFDRFGVERKDKTSNSKESKKPLVIPALKNKDWRELARKRKSASQYVPDSAHAKTGADGSVGGLGTRDVMNSGPELTGLQVPVRRIEQVDRDNDVPMAPPSTEDTEPESEDAAALRAIIAESSGQPSSHITIAPAVSEKEAFEQDVDELPESSTLAQYDRMPIEQFGAALLRGMGWTPGTAATKKKGKGMVEPWIPEARPALLGIGAKEREPLDDGSNRKKGRPDKKYVPLVKQEREPRSLRDRDGGRDREHSRRSRSRSPHSRHESRSRRSSRSPPPKRRDYEKDDRRSGSSRRDDYRERDKREDYREKDRPSRSYKDSRSDRSRDGDRNSRKY